MPTRVVVAEWRLGDWATVIRVGDRVRFVAYQCGPEDLDHWHDLLATSVEITHDIADMKTELTVDLHGQVDAITAVYATFPHRTGGTAIPGSGRLEPVQEATPITGDIRLDEGVVIAYLIDLADQEAP